MEKYSKRLIEETKEVWEKDYGSKISTQEALEIINNIVSLFNLLEELEEKYG